MSMKHFWGNVVEFTGFHNSRPLDTNKQMNRFANTLSGHRFRYRD